MTKTRNRSPHFHGPEICYPTMLVWALAIHGGALANRQYLPQPHRVGYTSSAFHGDNSAHLNAWRQQIRSHRAKTTPNTSLLAQPTPGTPQRAAATTSARPHVIFSSSHPTRKSYLGHVRVALIAGAPSASITEPGPAAKHDRHPAAHHTA